MNYPTGLAVDASGNVYVTDNNNQRVRRIDPTGIISTFAGTGRSGFSGDGGPAVQAQLNYPAGLAVDASGNLYVADRRNQRVRRIDAAGVITTFAGTGEEGFSGDGGPAAQARLDRPAAVAVDASGNVYVADAGNRRVRRIDAAGVITTFAGTGERGFSGDGGPAAQAQLSLPQGVAADASGNVYVADPGNHRVRRIDTAGMITTFAGTGEEGFSGDGGPATQAALSYPASVAADGVGNVYITGYESSRVRRIDTAGVISTFAGTGEEGFSGDGGPAVQAQFNAGHDGFLSVATDASGNVYIADSENHRVRRIDTAGMISTFAGTGEPGFSGDGGPAAQAQLIYPAGVAADESGNLYVADVGNHRVRRIDTAGVISTIAGTGEEGFSGDGGSATQAALSYPIKVAVDGAGNVYVTGYESNRVRRIDTAGAISTIAGTGEEGFSGDGGPAIQARFNVGNDGFLFVAADASGNVYVTDRGNHRVRRIDTAGMISTIAGTGEPGFSGDGGPAAQAQLAGPAGVAADASGNIYIADLGNHRIRNLTPGDGSTPPNETGPGATLPGKPRPPTVSAATPYSLTVSWAEPENSGAAITGYDVRYREGDSGAAFSDAQHEGTARTATISGLIPNTAYEVQVRATNSAGTGDWSEQGEGRTKPLLTGGHTYYFPHLAVGASWQTTITYINYSPEEVSCQTDFLSDQGSPLMVSFPSLGSVDSRADVLPPGGSVHEETDVELSAPVAAGWALAACSGPVKASLLFRQHDREGIPVAEAGVNAAAVPATRFVTFAEQAEGQAGTGVAYANPSSTESLITFMAKDTAGQTLASEDLRVSPGGHGAKNMASLFDLPSFTGSLEVTSTEPIVTLSLNAEAPPIFSSLPPGEPDAGAQGPTTYYFPHLAVGASWQTTITYINYSSEEVTCETEFISDHGSPLLVSFPGRGMVDSRTDVLPPGGSVHEETDVDLGSMLVPGWAKAACTGPVKASLLFRQYDSEGAPVGEAGVNAAAVPGTRFVTFAEQAEGKTGTGVAYANPSTKAAHVTFTAKDTAGQTLASEDRTLLPDGHDAHVMSVLFGFTSFSGSIEVTSTEPIVTLSLNFEAAPVFSSLPPGEVD